jgi:hypothetical protein
VDWRHCYQNQFFVVMVPVDISNGSIGGPAFVKKNVLGHQLIFFYANIIFIRSFRAVNQRCIHGILEGPFANASALHKEIPKLC